MKMSVVFAAGAGNLEKAKKALVQIGIQCRITRPRRQEGLLKVAETDAEKARRFLDEKFKGRVISEAEAAFFNCYNCGATLSEGQFYCPRCQVVVGDPHGR